jgi:hypothetical protein
VDALGVGDTGAAELLDDQTHRVILAPQDGKAGDYSDTSEMLNAPAIPQTFVGP